MSKEVKVTVDKKKIDSLIGNAQLALLEIEKNAEILSEMGFNIKIMIIACLYLLFRFVFRFLDTPLLSAFVLEYIIEPFIVEKTRP